MIGRRINVGILNPAHASGHGGYHQYMQALVRELSAYDDLRLIVFHDDAADASRGAERTERVQLPPDHGRVHRIVRMLSSAAGIRVPVAGRFSELRRHELDCLVSPASLIGFHLGIPFVGIIFDLIHKYYPQLADYPLRERLARQVIYRRFVQHAARTVTDSERGRQEVIRHFRGDPDRIRPVPLCPGPHVYAPASDLDDSEVARRFQLPDRYVLYPAQLWEHKNHQRLFQALAILRDEHRVIVNCVLVGSRAMAGDRTLARIGELNLGSQVKYLGYVPDAELVSLYRMATALVYPSFGDYTNMPVLEAMQLGVPVACANVFAMPEQLGDAGLLFDPFDITDMAKQIMRLWSDDDCRRELARRGRMRAPEYSPAKFGERWHQVVLECAATGPRSERAQTA